MAALVAPDDQTLLEALADGDLGALRELYDRHAPWLREVSHVKRLGQAGAATGSCMVTLHHRAASRIRSARAR